MNILITGGAGFIGSHTADILLKNGYNVIIADNLCSGKENNLNNSAKFYKVDISSPELEKIFIENKIDFVFHFAAQASVSVSNKNPLLDAENNIMGSINLLSICKKYNVKKFIAASTAAVYGFPEYLPVDENHKTECLSFYGLSKLTMENYIKLFGIDYIIFRYANVYGPRQLPHGEAGVISIFLDKIINNKPLEIHSNGNQTRDFVSVTDIAKVNLLAIEKTDIKNKTINVSTNTRISINDLFNTLKSYTDYNIEPVYTQSREGDIEHSVLDNKLCKSLFDWKPEVSLQEGLKQLVDSCKNIN
ncbi:MAG: NAD-dependent epimerase/dehydratase family protein [bacterium]